MSLGEIAKLIIQLDLKGNAQAGIKKVSQELTKLDTTVNGKLSSGFKNLGAGLGIAFIRAGAIAVGAIGGIVTAVGELAREGQNAANVQTIYAQSIRNSGLISDQYVNILNDQQKALMMLSGVDNEVIKAEQTKLIQMGLTGKQVAEITPLVLDFAEATGTDLLDATKIVGKAIQGNSGSLTKYGVAIDKARFKTDPYVATQEALNKAFGGTTAALSTGLDTKLKVFNEGIKNIREEAGIRLLPALTHLVDVAGKKLVPAFSKFVDKIIPALIKGIGDLADLIESGGVSRGIDTITQAIGPMVKVLQMAVGPVKAIVSTFLKLPQKVQAALISGVILNKLSGGLVAQGGKDILGAAGSLAGPTLGTLVGTVLGKLGLSRGGSPATPLFVMDVQNRLPNGQFAAGTTSKLTSLGSALQKVFIVGEAVGLVAAVLEVRNSITDGINQQATELQTQTQDFIKSQPNKEALLQALRGVNNGISDLKSNPLNVLVQGDALTKLEGIQATLIAQLGVLNGIKLGPLAYHERGGKDQPVTPMPTIPRIHIPTNPHRAGGGPVKRGLGYLVGEQGPEWFAPPVDGQIYRHGLFKGPHAVDRENAQARMDENEYVRMFTRGADLRSMRRREYASGEYDVPYDMPAKIHKGEMIVPKPFAKAIRALMQAQGARRAVFVPGVKLDASQIQDRRPAIRDWSPLWRGHGALTGDLGRHPIQINTKVTTSTRDQTTAAIVRRRWGPTPAQVGAG